MHRCFCLLLLLPCAISLPTISLKQLATKERIFVDPSGRQRLFHGANVIVKGPPWLPSRDGFDYQTSLVKEDFELMREAGMNSLRLGVMWPGAEPVRGSYNETYFKEIKAIIDEAAQYGIYTLADMHQDVLSERFCGEGVPAWAASTDGALMQFPQPFLGSFKNGPDGFPTRQDCAKLAAKLGAANGQEGYATSASAMAFQNLYTNHDGLTDAWGLFFAKFATVTKSSPSVLGLELINEPWTGNAWHDPLRMLPKVANKMLQGAYNIVSKHIRSVAEDALIFFPGVPWSDLDNLADNDGFTAPPGGPEFANRSVLAFHYYMPPQAHETDKYIKIMLDNARRLGTATFLTETWGSGGPQQEWEKSVPIAEASGISWSYWEWKTFCKETPETLKGTSQNAAFGSCKTGVGGQLFNESGLKPERHRTLARMYAYAIQGVLDSHVYNGANSELTFSYLLDPTIQAPTEVFANPQWHGGENGDFSVVVSPPNVATVEVRPLEKSIHITAVPGAKAGKVSVSISPGRRSFVIL